MPEIEYVPKQFNVEHEYIIGQARRVCAEHAAQGFDLTLRQLYYQFVGHDLFPDDWTWTQVGQKWVKDPNGTKNADPNYKRLGIIINDARLAGWLDWDYIVDRTRKLDGPGTVNSPHWDSPASIIEAAARGFVTDKWADQEYRVEVWIEKDALIGVLERACPALDVPYFSCRGYTSQSEVWGAGQRLRKHIDNDQKVAIIHLGDHDPSGIDMTRDIEARLSMFLAIDLGYERPGYAPNDYVGAVEELVVDRVALNMDQIRRYNPPPNPAKLSDARAKGYVRRFGNSSWELDALDVGVLVALVQQGVLSYREDAKWDAAVQQEKDDGAILRATHERWGEVKTFLNGSKP